MSLVEVSPSMEMLLKDLVTAAVSADCKRGAEMGASVQMMPRRVAMLGWIMPAPLVMPAMLYSLSEPGSVNVRETSLGNVSVVQMAFAAPSQWSCEEPRL